MQTARDIAPYAALAAAALALLLLVLVFVLWASVRRLRRAQTLVLGHHEERDIVAHMEDLDTQVRNMREAVETLTAELEGHRQRLNDTITSRAIVRYDAFRDTGGEQSASLALLDSHRSGLVLSTIAARDFARVYVKWLQGGVPDRDLSPEEQQAVAEAVPQPQPGGGERQPTELHGTSAASQTTPEAPATPASQAAPAAEESVRPLTAKPADAEDTTPAPDPSSRSKPAFEHLADEFHWDTGGDHRST